MNDDIVVDDLLGEMLGVDLETLALLHDKEPERSLIEELRQAQVQDWFGLRLEGETAKAGLALIDQALDAMPRPVDPQSLDNLAVDYADIYLVHALRATPTESPWIDPEGLERQEPMFDVRRWYQHYGLDVVDWRKRSDDHLVLELRFLAFLLRQAPDPEMLLDATRFLDAHLLRWVPRFAGRVASRCQTPFFAGLAMLTDGYLNELRDLLTIVTGEERPAVPASDDEKPAVQEVDAYVPGVGPSW